MVTACNIICVHYFNNFIINYIDDLSSPSNISMTKASHERLTFSWTPVTHSCSALHYIINSEDCGDCPSTVNTTTVDCFMIEQVQPNDITKCIISVRAALCENNNSSHGNLSSRSFLLRGTYYNNITIMLCSTANIHSISMHILTIL